MSSDQKGILLESGTNELEIVEFLVGQNTFGINVIKVKEIINVVSITSVPHAHPFVEGIIQLRGEVLPVVDMGKVLGYGPSDNPTQDKYIVCEFNQTKIVYHVHGVTQIHRISWEQIEKPSEMYQGLENLVIGVIKVHGDMVLLLDYEKIVVDINPKSGINVGQMKSLGKRNRSDKKVLIAEDSPLLRKLLEETLSEAGYDNLILFENGSDAYEHLQKLVEDGKDIGDQLQLVITDIEMPKMDGHHLTKQIKEHPSLKKLPVIIFSSLITDDLKHKGEVVGANAQISKPEIVNLVKLMDKEML